MSIFYLLVNSFDIAFMNKRVSIITGGARGIGRGCALKLASRGSAIVLIDLLEEEILRTKSEIQEIGSPCLTFVSH